ncbi:MAG: sulfur reduction protein DsrJ [Chromatiales bacterium]|jgi:hypothetical protein
MIYGSMLNKALGACLLIAGVLALAGPGAAAEEEGWREGNSRAAGLDQCVRPTEWMRRNHMELIKHQRNKTVHLGVRNEDLSLAGCVYCHVQYDASRQPIAINSEGQFCDSCHEFAAVTLDCFQCHATVPTPETTYGEDAGREGDQR